MQRYKKNKKMRIPTIRKSIAASILLAITFCPGTLYAAVLIFQLHSHPDGNAAPPTYGLRLDGLYNLDGSATWTFDFDHPQSSMSLVLDTDAATLSISGQAYGGLAGGGAYDPVLQGLWDIEFSYVTNVAVDTSGFPAVLAVEVNPEAPLDNNGTITPLFSASSGDIEIVGGSPISLEQEMEFFLNNIDDHRLDCGLACVGLSGPETFVGWGWLNHSGADHINASDWLFTAQVIPVPAAVWLFASALGLLGGLRSRRISD